MIPSIPQPEPGPAPSHSPLHPRRILLVDDDPLILFSLTAILSRAGYAVVSCAGGTAAAEIFRQNDHFDLLITDFQMPVINGVALANLLTEAARQLPVLLVSGTAVDLIPLSELRQEKWSFLAKPAPPPLLLETVAQLCGCAPSLHSSDLHAPAVSS